MADEPKKGSSLILTAILGLVGAMIPTLVIMLLVKTCDDPIKQKNKYQREMRVQHKAEPEDPVIYKEYEEGVPDVAVTEKEDLFLTLEDELLALAPSVYLSVRFLHESGKALTPGEIEESAGVHTVEITVKSEAWDKMNPDRRVILLNDTFKFIRDRFPDMTQLLRLAYDDQRPSFDMKFGNEI